MKKFILLSILATLFLQVKAIDNYPSDWYLNFPLDWGEARDISNNHFTATIVGTTTPTTDRYGFDQGALEFNGSTYIDINANSAIGTSDFTISFWAYTYADNSGCIFSKEEAGVGQNQFRIGESGGDFGNFSDNSQGGSLSYTSTPNVWTLYTIVRSGNKITLNIGIGNMLYTSCTTTTPLNHSNTLNFRIGGRYNSTNCFKGKIDNVRMFKRALSENELSSLRKTDNIDLKYAGTLKSQIGTKINTCNQLAVTGNIDASDFKTIRDLFKSGSYAIDLSGANIISYSGTEGIDPTITFYRENEIPESAFIASMHYLNSIILPNSITTINNEAFYKQPELKTITIPNSVTTIKSYAFGLCYNLASLTIGSSVTSIEGGAFNGCTALTSINVLNPTPISIPSSVFSGVSTIGCTLYVPVGTKEAYAAAPVWKDFLNIVEYPNVVTNVVAPQAKLVNLVMAGNQLTIANVASGELITVYNVSGTVIYQQQSTGESISVALPQRGIYVVKADNQSVKVSY